MTNEVETQNNTHTHTHTKVPTTETEAAALDVNTGLLISAIVLFIASAVSIGVSGGQYQNDDGGVQWSPSWDTICDRWPQDMLRPFGLKLSGNNNFSYCGYSDAMTGYRLFAAIVTFLFSIYLLVDGLVMKALQRNAAIHMSLYWVTFALWWLAGGFDILAVANGQRACQNGFQSFFSGSTCDNSVYGVSIAIDAVMLVILACLIYFMTAEEKHEIRQAQLKEQANEEILAAHGNVDKAANNNQPQRSPQKPVHDTKEIAVAGNNEPLAPEEQPRPREVESKEAVLDELDAEAGHNRV